MASDAANMSMQKLQAFTKKQMSFMCIASMSAFALPFLPLPWKADVFAIKDFLLTISIVLLGFVMASMSAFFASIKAMDPKSNIYRILQKTPTKLYARLVKSVRRLINCIFINAAFGLMLIIYAPGATKCLGERGFVLNALSGLILASMVLCGCMIWLVAARFLNVMLNVKASDTDEAN